MNRKQHSYSEKSLKSETWNYLELLSLWHFIRYTVMAGEGVGVGAGENDRVGDAVG